MNRCENARDLTETKVGGTYYAYGGPDQPPGFGFRFTVTAATADGITVRGTYSESGIESFIPTGDALRWRVVTA